MILDIDIYTIRIHCFVGGDADSILKSLKKRKTRKGKPFVLSTRDSDEITSALRDDDLGFVYEFDEMHGHYIFWIKKYGDDIEDLATVVHEATHLAIKVFTRISCNINEETEEPFCYLHDYIVGRIIKWLRDGLKNTHGEEGPV